MRDAKERVPRDDRGRRGRGRTPALAAGKACRHAPARPALDRGHPVPPAGVPPGWPRPSSRDRPRGPKPGPAGDVYAGAPTRRIRGENPSYVALTPGGARGESAIRAARCATGPTPEAPHDEEMDGRRHALAQDECRTPRHPDARAQARVSAGGRAERIRQLKLVARGPPLRGRARSLRSAEELSQPEGVREAIDLFHRRRFDEARALRGADREVPDEKEFPIGRRLPRAAERKEVAGTARASRELYHHAVFEKNRATSTGRSSC